MELPVSTSCRLLLFLRHCLKSFKHFHNISLCLLNAKLRPSMCVDMDKLNGQRTDHLKLSQFRCMHFASTHTRRHTCMHANVYGSTTLFAPAKQFHISRSFANAKQWRAGDGQCWYFCEPYLKSWCRHTNRESDYSPLSIFPRSFHTLVYLFNALLCSTHSPGDSNTHRLHRVTGEHEQ